MPVNFGNAIEVSKVIPIDGINEMRTLYFGGALLLALIFERLTFLIFLEKNMFFEVLRLLL